MLEVLQNKFKVETLSYIKSKKVHFYSTVVCLCYDIELHGYYKLLKWFLTRFFFSTARTLKLKRLPTFPPLKRNVLFLHSLVLRLKLPVHRHREAEQAARVPALLQDIFGVQVETRQPPTSREEDEQPESTGDPAALHEKKNSQQIKKKAPKDR